MSPNSKIEEGGKKLDLSQFHLSILEWGRENFREYPWRYTKKKYKVLIAEIMLQRTRADQVLPVYRNFIEKYPDAPSLFEASIDEIRKIIRPLGIHSRADTIYEIASTLEEAFGGRIPESRDQLESLSGVGQYTAGAVRCFALGKAEALIDTNTVRVSARLFGLNYKPSSRRSAQFLCLIEKLLDKNNPRRYNFAMLDLADSTCHKRTDPDCEQCPLKHMCTYGKDKLNQ